MKFQNEVGAIVDKHGNILHVTEGSPSHIDFPWEVIKKLHNMSPGTVFLFAHVHPPYMTELSSTDKGSMKAWARALYPFPVRMSTITEVDKWDDVFEAVETIYYAQLQSKEEWKREGGEIREFKITQEPWTLKKKIYTNNETISSNYAQQLLKLAYE